MENDISRSDRGRVRSGVILWRTMKAVGAQRIFIVYLVFLLVCCAMFRIVEPEGLSALFVVALLTGVTVSFFNEKMRLRRNESFIEFDHGMEHLTELSPDQLVRLEEQYRAFKGRKDATDMGKSSNSGL